MQRDPAYLREILEAARLALLYVQDVDQLTFIRNTQLQDAVIRRLEIIGEAARRISDETRATLPEIPWRQLIGMRNQVIHLYDGVDMEIVWNTVFHDLPALLETLLQAGVEGR